MIPEAPAKEDGVAVGVERVVAGVGAFEGSFYGHGVGSVEEGLVVEFAGHACLGLDDEGGICS